MNLKKIKNIIIFLVIIFIESIIFINFIIYNNISFFEYSMIHFIIMCIFSIAIEKREYIEEKLPLYIAFFLPAIGIVILFLLYISLNLIKNRSNLIDEYQDYISYLNDISIINKNDYIKELNVIPAIDSLKKENNDKKKDLIINLISEDINLKVKILKTALKDDDTEVVHYSSSILNMIEEEYEETINYLKKEYIKSESKKDLKQLLNIYYNYINSGLINKKLLDFDLKQYIEITEEYEERFDEDIELVIKKIDILIKSNKNQKALEVINKLNMRNIKEVYIYKLKALYNLKRYNQLIKESQEIKRMELELDEQLQSVLDFWS